MGAATLRHFDSAGQLPSPLASARIAPRTQQYSALARVGKKLGRASLAKARGILAFNDESSGF